MGYCEPSEVLSRMGRVDTVTANANQNVTDAIEAASAAIDEDCNRTFEAAADETRDLPVGGSSHRRLDIPDLISATTIALDYDGDGTFETVLTTSEYELDSFHALNYLDVTGARAVWPFEFVTLLGRTRPITERRRRLQIEGSWGWPAVPAAINQACSILSTRLMQRMSAAPFGVQNYGEFSAGIRATDPDYQALIAPYRRMGVA